MIDDANGGKVGGIGVLATGGVVTHEVSVTVGPADVTRKAILGVEVVPLWETAMAPLNPVGRPHRPKEAATARPGCGIIGMLFEIVNLPSKDTPPARIAKPAPFSRARRTATQTQRRQNEESHSLCTMRQSV